MGVIVHKITVRMRVETEGRGFDPHLSLQIQKKGSLDSRRTTAICFLALCSRPCAQEYCALDPVLRSTVL